MSIRPRTILLTLIVFGVSSAAFAAEEKADDKAGSGFVQLFLLLPLLLFIGWLVVFTRKSGAMKQGGYLSKAGDHMDRTTEHMARIEQKTDRMIQLLESIDEQLRSDHA